MPYRSPSYSPRDDDRVRKHKHKHSSHSQDRRHRSRSTSRERSRHHKHKSSSRHHKHKRDRSVSDSEDDRRRRDSGRDSGRSRHHRQDNQDADERRQNDDRRTQNHRNRNRGGRGGGRGNNPFQSDQPEMEYGRPSQNDEPEVKVEKDKPNFEVSGKLAEETNTYKGIVIKYSEPAEARKPRKRWRLYPFKGDEILKIMHIHRQSAYLLGRDRRVADIPIDHPSCSKQHAVLQFRLVNYTRDNGTEGRRIRPYVIDLGAANGTYLNSQRIDANRYYELMEKDVLKFGYSSREYVVLTDKADTSEIEQEEYLEGEGADDIDD